MRRQITLVTFERAHELERRSLPIFGLMRDHLHQDLLRKRVADSDLDFLREAVAVLAKALMEAEVSAQIGAGYRERTPGRLTQRPCILPTIAMLSSDSN